MWGVGPLSIRVMKFEIIDNFMPRDEKILFWELRVVIEPKVLDRTFGRKIWNLDDNLHLNSYNISRSTRGNVRLIKTERGRRPEVVRLRRDLRQDRKDGTREVSWLTKEKVMEKA